MSPIGTAAPPVVAAAGTKRCTSYTTGPGTSSPSVVSAGFAAMETRLGHTVGPQ